MIGKAAAQLRLKRAEPHERVLLISLVLQRFPTYRVLQRSFAAAAAHTVMVSSDKHRNKHRNGMVHQRERHAAADSEASDTKREPQKGSHRITQHAFMHTHAHKRTNNHDRA
jgi:hypothetical protein